MCFIPLNGFEDMLKPSLSATPKAKDFVLKCKILLAIHICVSLWKAIYFGFNKGFNELITCFMLFFAIQKLDYCCMIMYMFTNM
jgi:hypothetical protein